MMKRMLAALLLMVVCASAALAEDENRYEELGRWSYDDSGLIAVKRDGLWGFVNGAGELVIPCEWEWVDSRFNWHEFIRVEKEGRIGFFNARGESVTGEMYPRESVEYTCDREHLFLLRDGVLSIYLADGTKVY